jgi:hypothetical protein
MRFFSFAAKQLRTLAVLLAIVPIGFYSKFYHGPAAEWVNNSLGGVFYVMFWSLFLQLVAPKISIMKNVGAVFTVTCVLEVLQLWHPAFLEKIRCTFIGATLLGTTFVGLDMVYYLIGAVAAAFLIALLHRMPGR